MLNESWNSCILAVPVRIAEESWDEFIIKTGLVITYDFVITSPVLIKYFSSLLKCHISFFLVFNHVILAFRTKKEPVFLQILCK